MNQPALPQPAKSSPTNWKLIGVIGGVLFLLGCAFFGGIFWFVITLMKSNGAFTGAMERAKKNPEVIALLGEPIEAGLFVSGKVNVSGASGTARLNIPLSGPKGGGSLYVAAEQVHGTWRFNDLTLQTSNGPLSLLKIRGVVKSYDKEKGQGWLTSGDGGKDIFVERDDVLMHGDPELKAGQDVEFEVVEDEKGPRAAKVRVKNP